MAPPTPSTFFHPEFAGLFPELYDWAIFVDYNMDGKNDIFTYSPGYASMMVYQNISDETLKFKRVVYPYLTSYQGGGYVNIYVTYADYPGISMWTMTATLIFLLSGDWVLCGNASKYVHGKIRYS